MPATRALPPRISSTDQLGLAVALICVGLIPLAVVPEGDRLYFLPKLLLLRAAIGLGLCGALGVAIQERRHAGGFPVPIRSPVRKHLPELFAPALTVWLAVATAASATPLQALWGSHQRLQGLATYACYIGLFLLVSRFVNTPRSVRQVLGAASVASMPVASLALLQQFGWQPFSVDPGYAGRS
ncbi:MAG: hypothetical protein KGJ86_18925, partial [Chloroflexota bacterium]|nr:hypothetical protein [Chloroflexota bacterium]